MGILVVGGEKDFDALHSRLFAGRVSAAAARRARAALAKANPHADLSALRPGTVLTIPDAPELPGRGALSLDGSVRDGVAALAQELTDTLDVLRGEADGQERGARAERKRTLEQFDDEAVRRAAAGDPDIAAALDAARQALDEEDAASKTRLAGLGKAIDEWTAEIETLRGLAG